MKKNQFLVIISLSIVAAILLIIFKPKPQNQYEEKFDSILDNYDSTYNARLKELETNEILRVYELKDDQKGYIVASHGYKDIILMFVVLDKEDVKQVEILYHAESKDYGSHVEEQWFLDRLLISSTEKLQTVKIKKENPNDIVAITGATITSKAVVKGVNSCIEKNDGRE